MISLARKLFFLIMFGFSIASWSGDYVNGITCLVIATMPLVCEAIDVTDQWTFDNVVAQSVLGGLGVVVLSINFISGHYFWRKTQDAIQHDLQNHIDDLEETNFQRQQLQSYIERSERLFMSMVNDKQMQQDYRKTN